MSRRLGDGPIAIPIVVPLGHTGPLAPWALILLAGVAVVIVAVLVWLTVDLIRSRRADDA